MKPSIELTSYCNNKCQHCPYQHKPIERGFMKPELFKKLVDELAPLSEALHIFNRGEPTMHPKFYELAQYAADRCKIIVASNGILLDVDKFLEIKGEKQLIISIPAGNRKTYKQITGTDKFISVINKAKKLDKDPTIDFSVKFVTQKENEGQEKVLIDQFRMVYVVEDSNGENIHGYQDCTQPDVCPTYDWKGNKKVCCRDWNSKHPFKKYYEKAKKRQLNICKNCNIR